ncbi:penicillin-binding protein 1A [Paucibacter oligotrophus]|uniref:Penicillin-binding protein 1A n=1 Tax=Roseateles oligotrophus TaxID=1769250 RepID=A0A840L610_9BURK|nr:PBP1A family penicillin-binding protein [Roseateles oligotrophus]MBB4844004.1 penicillin-binding protein 1A [Roseateles oligotrophus]
MTADKNTATPLARILAWAQDGRVWRRLLVWAGAGLALILLLLAIAAAFVYPTLPDLDNLSDYKPKQPLRVYTADGQLIGEFGAERRHYLPLAQIPKRMQDALLATEDRYFYSHGGIDVRGVARALLANLTASRSQGGSTVTQQLARDLYLTKKKLYSRKFIEALLAYKIESQLSKEKILEVYLNQIYLGQRAYGFEAAAETYFGKSLKDLSLAETAMLAGLPKNPAYANPISNFQRAKRRQLVVLESMKDFGVIKQAELDQAKVEELRIRSAQDPRLHAEFAAEMARQAVYAQYGDEAYTLGLQVHTGLIADQQGAAYKGLRRTLLELERRKPYRGPEGFVELPKDEAEQDDAIDQALSEHPDNDDLRAAVVLSASPSKILAVLQSGDEALVQGEGLRSVQAALAAKARPELRIRPGAIIRLLRGNPSKAEPQGAWMVTQSPEAEGAIVAVEPATGLVRALVGGFDFHRNKFNHVTQAYRQPGSSFKPIVYSAALEQGIGPATLVEDAPLVFGSWEPKNSDGQFDGPMTVRTALARSKNMVTLRVMEQVGPARARAWAGRFGLEVDKQPADLTLALGSGAATPLQMASAYAVFANGGYALKPLLITRILDAKGAVLFEAKPQAPAEELRAISERNAFVMSSLLQEVTRSGTAARASGALRRSDIYGKTGTTNDSVDAWFAGYQKNLAAVVWVGYDNPRSLGDREFGGGLAMPAWIDLMAVALKNVPISEIAPPAEGLLHSDGDWSFEEFAGEAGVRYLGSNTEAVAAAASAASAAAAGLAPPAAATAGSATTFPVR